MEERLFSSLRLRGGETLLLVTAEGGETLSLVEEKGGETLSLVEEKGGGVLEMTGGGVLEMTGGGVLSTRWTCRETGTPPGMCHPYTSRVYTHPTEPRYVLHAQWP